MSVSLTSISRFLVFILKQGEVNLTDLEINNFLTEIDYILHQKAVKINGDINYGFLRINLCGSITHWLKDACKNVNIDESIIANALPNCLIFKSTQDIVEVSINDHTTSIIIFCSKCDSEPWCEDSLNNHSHLTHTIIDYLKSKQILDPDY